MRGSLFALLVVFSFVGCNGSKQSPPSGDKPKGEGTTTVSEDTITLDQLTAGWPENARPESRDDAIQIKRAEDWLAKKVEGKRYMDRHVIRDVTVGTEEGGRFRVWVYPDARAIAGDASWRVFFTTRESGYGSGGLLIRQLDDMAADQLQKLKGQTAVVSGRFDSVSFHRSTHNLMLILADVKIEPSK